MCKCAAFLWGCLLFLGTPVLALNPNDLSNQLVEISQPSSVAASPYIVDGVALGGRFKSRNQAYQCRPSDKFSGFIWCHEEHTTPDNQVMRSHSILQSQDGTAYYVNSYFQPAFFDPSNIQNEIDRMSFEFGEQARIIQMSQREGFPSAVMAIWGAIQLEPLKPDEISILTSGGNPSGILVSFLGDEERSAKAGVPVYRVGGGPGFLWVANFDRDGRGALQYLAIDDSKIEPSRQVAANSENEAGLNSNPVSPSVVAQPTVPQRSPSDAQAQAEEDQHQSDLEAEKRSVEDAAQQQTEAQQQQLSEAQNQKLATTIEIAIAIFAFLCGGVVAIFLRMSRRTAPKQF